MTYAIVDDEELNAQLWCPWCGIDTPGGFCCGECQARWIADVNEEEYEECLPH